jgi:hypothetical protein
MTSDKPWMQEIADLASINADETEKIGSVRRAPTLPDTARVGRPQKWSPYLKICG